MEAATIISAVQGVTKKWTKQRKAEERHSRAAARRYHAMTRSQRDTLRSATWQVMKSAYMSASNDGQYPAHARQIMYAARPDIQEITRRTLDDKYFTQTLLPDYLAEKSPEWDVVFDARGHFTEPHTGKIVPLGTLDVRKYLSELTDGAVTDDDKEDDDAFEYEYKTVGPKNWYGAILFIEKEGFMPLFKQAELEERFDIAIMSTKGMSVTASRRLVETLCSQYSIPLLVLRDFDKSGFSIVGTLQRDTRRYQFMSQFKVIDLGLRLEDVRKYNLQSESVSYRSTPVSNLSINGATTEEIEFLCSEQSWRGCSGQRVELNAFTSADLIEWIESKLCKHGVKKVIPDDDTLRDAYRQALMEKLTHERMETIKEEVRKQVDDAKPPKRLAKFVTKELRARTTLSWDDIIAEIANDYDHTMTTRIIELGSP